MKIDEGDAELIIKWYTELERRFVGVIHTVPITAKTSDVFLPSLTSIILDSCSLIDTIFRSSLPSKQQKNADIKTYAAKFEADYQLSSKRSLVYQFPVRAVIPFDGWFENGTPKAPPWWKAHNALKHDRLKNFEKSTIETTLLSLAGLHQAIAINPSFMKPLLRHEMLSFGNYSWEYAMEAIEQGDMEKAHPGLIESELFASLCGKASFDEDLLRVRVAWLGHGRKLAKQLGRQF